MLLEEQVFIIPAIDRGFFKRWLDICSYKEYGWI